MAKEEKDKFTADMIAPRRGRPPTPFPMTATERKAAQRARAKAAGMTSLTIEVSTELLYALKYRCKATATRPERTQREVIEEILSNQLLRKR